MTVSDLIDLPWTVNVEFREDDGIYFMARVEELPGLVATARPGEDLSVNLREALSSHLQSYIEDGETPPMPGTTNYHVFSIEMGAPSTAAATRESHHSSWEHRAIPC